MFIITDKTKLVGEEVKGVGVMKDEELKLEEVFVYYESRKRELKIRLMNEGRCSFFELFELLFIMNR